MSIFPGVDNYEVSDYESTDMVAILMARDGMSREEVMENINDFKEELLTGEFYDPEEAFMDEFGLEPDYLEDLF